MIIFVDIDNTIADIREREAIAGRLPKKVTPKCYRKWLSVLQPKGGFEKDKVVSPMLELLNSIRSIESMVWIFFLTSREEKHRKDTVDWLNANKFDIPNAQLFMRKNRSLLPAWKEKHKVIKKLLKKNPLPKDENVIFIDDDPEIANLCDIYGWLHLIPRLPSVTPKKTRKVVRRDKKSKTNKSV